MLTDHTLNKWAELLDNRSFWEGPTTLERYELAELHSMARELIEARRAASTVIEQQAEIERLRDGYNAGVQDAAMIMQKRADQMMELGEEDMMVRYFGSAVQIQSLIKDDDQ